MSKKPDGGAEKNKCVHCGKPLLLIYHKDGSVYRTCPYPHCWKKQPEVTDEQE